MIFETKNKDLIVRVERVIEVEKVVDDGIKSGSNERIKVYSLKVFTLDTQRKIIYDNEKDRNDDYNNIKMLLSSYEKLTSCIKSLDEALKGL